MATPYSDLTRLLAAAALAAAVTPSAGCSGSAAGPAAADESTVGGAGWSGTSVPLLPALPPGFDYVAMRASGELVVSFGGEDPRLNGALLREIGPRCPAACGERLAIELDVPLVRNRLIFVKGTDIIRVEDAKTFVAMFGPIDDASKAGLLVWVSGHQLEGLVSEDGRVAAPVAVFGSGFEVSTKGSRRCVESDEAGKEHDVEWRDMLRVTRKGTIWSKERTVLRRGVLYTCR